MDGKSYFRFSSRQPMQRLYRAGEDRLVIGTTRFVQAVAWMLAAVAIAAVVNSRRGELWIYTAVFGFCALGLWFFPARTVFDRKTGRLSLRRAVSVRQFSLAAIKSVRIIDGGWHFPSRGFGRPYQTSQLILTLAEEHGPQLQLTNHGDHDLTKAMASQIAEFLDVPMLDMAQLADGTESNREANDASSSETISRL